MLHAVSTSDARNKPKTCRAAPLRHARRAPLEHRAGASPRARFTRAPPTRGRIIRADRAVHADMRHVLGLEDAPAHCPATGGAAGQHRTGAIGVRQAGHYVATFCALRAKARCFETALLLGLGEWFWQPPHWSRGRFSKMLPKGHE